MKQDNLENRMPILNSKLDKLIQFMIKVIDSGGSEDHKAELLAQYFENHHGHLRVMGRSDLKREFYKVRKTKLCTNVEDSSEHTENAIYNASK